MRDSRPDLRDFHQDVLMEEMAETVGVQVSDIADLDGGKSYLQARNKCHRCAVKSACKTWLQQNAEGAPQEFCPNVDLFELVKANKGGL